MKLGRLLGIGIAALVALVAAAPAGAVTITEFAANPGKAANPQNIVSGPEGNLWWTEAGLELGIGRISPSGERFPIIPTAQQPVDLVVAPSGWVSWTSLTGYGTRSPGGLVTNTPTGDVGGAMILNPSNEIRWGRMEGGGGATVCRGTRDNASEGLTGCAGASGVTGRVTGLGASTQKLWASYFDLNQVRTYDPGVNTSKAVDLPTASGPTGIAIGPEGDAWVTMTLANAVDRIAPDGTRTRFPLAAGSEPQDIALGPDGAFWIAEYGAEKIGRMTTAGVVTNEYPAPSPGAEIGGITAGPDGNIWFTEASPGKIARLVPDPPLGPAPVVPAAARDTTAPKFLGSPSFSPSRFAVAGNGKARASKAVKAPGGSSLKLSLSEAASVTATIVKSVSGRRSGKKCVAPGKAKPGAAKCTRYVTKGGLTLSAKQGPNKFPFSGKLKGKALPPGAYQATFVARDAAGNSSSSRTAAFTIVP